MAFKFALETVLKHRQRLEEIAQREYAEAQANVDVALKALEAMYARMDEVRAEIMQAQKSNAMEHIRQMESFLVGHKVRIEERRLEIRQLLIIAEDKQEALIAAAKERKVLVQLREKRQAEYRDWQNRIETKILDDQTNMSRARVKR